MSKESKCHNIHLLSLVEETIRIIDSFEEINFKHIEREHNMIAEGISKSVLMQKGG